MAKVPLIIVSERGTLIEQYAPNSFSFNTEF